MLIAVQRFHLGRRHQLLQEAAHDSRVQQTIPALGERRGVPDRIIRAEANKPAEQQVVVQLLKQQPLRADAVERLQQRGQHQLLGRD
jgi:hypothetical protein